MSDALTPEEFRRKNEQRIRERLDLFFKAIENTRNQTKIHAYKLAVIALLDELEQELIT